MTGPPTISDFVPQFDPKTMVKIEMAIKFLSLFMLYLSGRSLVLTVEQTSAWFTAQQSWLPLFWAASIVTSVWMIALACYFFRYISRSSAWLWTIMLIVMMMMSAWLKVTTFWVNTEHLAAHALLGIIAVGASQYFQLRIGCRIAILPTFICVLLTVFYTSLGIIMLHLMFSYLMQLQLIALSPLQYMAVFAVICGLWLMAMITLAAHRQLPFAGESVNYFVPIKIQTDNVPT